MNASVRQVCVGHRIDIYTRPEIVRVLSVFGTSTRLVVNKPPSRPQVLGRSLCLLNFVALAPAPPAANYEAAGSG